MLNLLPTQSKNNADNADNNLSQYYQAYHRQAIAVVGKERAEVMNQWGHHSKAQGIKLSILLQFSVALALVRKGGTRRNLVEGNTLLIKSILSLY
jgi:hypothetical protein